MLFPKQIGRYLLYLNLEGEIVICAPEDHQEMTDDEIEGILEYLLSRVLLFSRVLPNRKVGINE